MLLQLTLFGNLNLELKPPAPSPEEFAEIARIIEAVGDNSGDWKNRALDVVRQIAAERATLTADDVWDAMGSDVPQNDNRAMGAVFRVASKQGLICRLERTVKSKRKQSHFRDIRVWESLVFRGEF